MKDRSRDIYGTDRKLPDTPTLDRAQQNSLLEKPWAEAMQRQRRYTTILSLTAFLIIVLISVIVMTQYLRSAKQPAPQHEAGPIPRVGVVMTSPLDFYSDLQTQFMADELTEQEVQNLPEKGKIPLTANWVKQAAYYLLKAEKSFKDEMYDEALDNYNKALRIMPDIEGISRYIGLIYLREKNYSAAASMFEQVTKEEEITYGLANNLGVSYLALEDFKKAEESLLLATKLNTHYAIAFYNLATLYSRTGNLPKAAYYYEQYLELKPDDLAVAQTYAMLLVRQEKWNQAIVLLKQLSQAAPDVAPILFRLAEAYSHVQNPTAALEALHQAIALVDPRKALSWMSRPEFDLLRNDPGFKQLITELGATN